MILNDCFSMNLVHCGCCGHFFSADCDGLCGVVDIFSVCAVMGCVVLWTLFQCGL